MDEPFFSAMYADLCVTMQKAQDEKGQPRLPTFRRDLLNRCQAEFQKDRKAEKDALDMLERRKKAKIQELEAGGVKTLQGAAKTDVEEVQKIEDDEYRLKKERRRMFGNIKFIGELFKRGMVRAGDWLFGPSFLFGLEGRLSAG